MYDTSVKKEKIDEIVNKIQSKIDNKDYKKILTVRSIIEGMFATSSGGSEEFLVSIIKYKRQKSDEKNKELTEYYFEDVRDSFIIRCEEDAHVQDEIMQDLVKSTVNIIKMVSINYKYGDSDHSYGSSGENKKNTSGNEVPFY